MSDTDLWMTADGIFELLDAALAHAISENGSHAKAVAWDVSAYFMKAIGQHRHPARAQTPSTASAEGE